MVLTNTIVKSNVNMKIEKGERRSGTERKTAILNTATDLFLEQGYDRTSLEQIIKRTGGSRRVIYQEFGNKEGLLGAIVEAMIEELLDQFSVLSMPEQDPEKSLVETGTAFVKALISPRILAAFRLLIAEVTRFPNLGTTFFETGPERAYQRMSQYLRQQVAEGYFQIENPEITGRQLIEMMKGDLHLRALLCPDNLPTEAEIENHVRCAVHTFLQGVLKASE
ncbi:MAG: TetR/AcrR family transcriptional regulator [Cyanobacteriota bacterium]|nr:TetR/AcrR family transcriptional regulator [Cyanobacteriota bacterium]